MWRTLSHSGNIIKANASSSRSKRGRRPAQLADMTWAKYDAGRAGNSGTWQPTARPHLAIGLPLSDDSADARPYEGDVACSRIASTCAYSAKRETASHALRTMRISTPSTSPTTTSMPPRRALTSPGWSRFLSSCRSWRKRPARRL